MERKTITSGTKWEPIAGYSRAVRVGPFIHVAGTTSWGSTGKIVGAGDPYAQTVQILKNIEKALKEAGASLTDVVATRAFVTDVRQWEKVARAHGEVFRDIRPALTLVQVAGLVDPAMMVEIEAEAIVHDAPLH